MTNQDKLREQFDAWQRNAMLGVYGESHETS